MHAHMHVHARHFKRGCKYSSVDRYGIIMNYNMVGLLSSVVVASELLWSNYRDSLLYNAVCERERDDL